MNDGRDSLVNGEDVDSDSSDSEQTAEEKMQAEEQKKYIALQKQKAKEKQRKASILLNQYTGTGLLNVIDLKTVPEPELNPEDFIPLVSK